MWHGSETPGQMQHCHLDWIRSHRTSDFAIDLPLLPPSGFDGSVYPVLNQSPSTGWISISGMRRYTILGWVLYTGLNQYVYLLLYLLFLRWFQQRWMQTRRRDICNSPPSPHWSQLWVSRLAPQSKDFTDMISYDSLHDPTLFYKT